MRKIKPVYLAPLLFIPSLVFADIPAASDELSQWSDVEISAAVGVNWLHANNVVLPYSPNETDELVEHNAPHDAWRVGVGCHLFKQDLQQRQFFNDLLLEFNVYYNSQSISGDVWQYRFPQFNDYKFSAPVTSTRFMLDLKPTLFNFRGASFYSVLGVGTSLNQLYNYHDNADRDGEPQGNVSLGGQKTTQLSYDLGAGIRAHLTTMVDFSLEYLYSDLGHVSTAYPTEAAPLSAPTFKLSNQAIFLGLTWNI